MRVKLIRGSDVVKDLRFEDKDKDKDFPRGQQHWYEVLTSYQYDQLYSR